mgnify:CR=1 FL=1
MSFNSSILLGDLEPNMIFLLVFNFPSKFKQYCKNNLDCYYVTNFGINPVTSFDIDFLYNGNTITDNIIGLNLGTGAITTVTLTNPITLVNGTYTGMATVSNVNGTIWYRAVCY